MTDRIVIRRLAQAEIAEAAAWYDLQSTGLGLQFVDAVDRALNVIAEHPERWPLFYRDVHRFLVERFPYLIYCQHLGGKIRVLRVAHASRDVERLRDLLE